MTRINFRTSETTKEAFKAVCESEGKSMSQVLENFVQEKTGHTSKGRLPDNPQLAGGYETLYWLAAGQPVEVDDAEAAIANKLNMPKSSVRARIIKPLETRGYVTLRTGLSKVRYRPNVDLAADVLDYDPAATEASV